MHNKAYDNPTLEKEVEFYDDIKRFKYLKRPFVNIRLLVTKTTIGIKHIIVLNNVFGVEAACTLLLYKVDKHIELALKSFLVYA